jgi:hypothetical protein
MGLGWGFLTSSSWSWCNIDRPNSYSLLFKFENASGLLTKITENNNLNIQHLLNTAHTYMHTPLVWTQPLRTIPTHTPTPHTPQTHTLTHNPTTPYTRVVFVFLHSQTPRTTFDQSLESIKYDRCKVSESLGL